MQLRNRKELCPQTPPRVVAEIVLPKISPKVPPISPLTPESWFPENWGLTAHKYKFLTYDYSDCSYNSDCSSQTTLSFSSALRPRPFIPKDHVPTWGELLPNSYYNRPEDFRKPHVRCLFNELDYARPRSFAEVKSLIEEKGFSPNENVREWDKVQFRNPSFNVLDFQGSYGFIIDECKGRFVVHSHTHEDEFSSDGKKPSKITKPKIGSILVAVNTWFIDHKTPFSMVDGTMNYFISRGCKMTLTFAEDPEFISLYVKDILQLGKWSSNNTVFLKKRSLEKDANCSPLRRSKRLKTMSQERNKKFSPPMRQSNRLRRQQKLESN